MNLAGVEDRFWAKVRESEDDCWTWTAALYPNGYGAFRVRAGMVRCAHRIAYELVIGVIPPSLTIDHLCRNRVCVNPAHMELVTRSENTRRALTLRPPKTHCKRGHPLSGPNCRVTARQRVCRACEYQAWRRKWERILAQRTVR